MTVRGWEVERESEVKMRDSCWSWRCAVVRSEEEPKSSVRRGRRESMSNILGGSCVLEASSH